MTPNEADELIFDKIQNKQISKTGLSIDDAFNFTDEFKQLAGLNQIDLQSYSEYKSMNLIETLCEQMMKCCNKQCDVRRTKLSTCNQCQKSFYC